MKRNTGIKFHGAVLSAVPILFLCGLALMPPQTQGAPPPSPLGTWDCLTSGGGQQGIAFITFAEDGTFSGYQLLAGTPKKTSTKDLADERNLGEDIGRNPDLDDGIVLGTTNLFGFAEISGPWSYDVKGNVIGFYSAGIDDDTSGNGGAILSVSFSGKVVPGKRLTMVASTSNGKVTYKGVPFRELPDLSGSWYGTKKENKQTFLEFFTLEGDIAQNVYSMEGAGPAYDYGIGRCMVSAQKKIGFALLEGTSTNGVLRATMGSFSSKNGFRATTKGSKEPSTVITFDAFMTPQ